MGACYPKRQPPVTKGEAAANSKPKGNQVVNSPQSSIVSNGGIKPSQIKAADIENDRALVAEDQAFARPVREDILEKLDSQRSELPDQQPRESPGNQPVRRRSFSLDIPDELGEGEMVMTRKIPNQVRPVIVVGDRSRPTLAPTRGTSDFPLAEERPDESTGLAFTQPKLQNFIQPSQYPNPQTDPQEAVQDPLDNLDLHHYMPERLERPAAHRPAGEVKDEVIAPWKVAGAELSEGEKHLFFVDNLNFRTKNHQYLGSEYLLKKIPSLTVDDIWRQGYLKSNEDLRKSEQKEKEEEQGKGLFDQLFNLQGKPNEEEKRPAAEDPSKKKPVISVTVSAPRDRLAEVLERFSSFRKEIEKAIENSSVMLQINPEQRGHCEVFLNEERVLTFLDPNHLIKPSTITELAKKSKKK